MSIIDANEISKIFDAKYCLVCGLQLETATSEYSQEHIFPKWLLTRYSLWNSTIILLNDTKLRYKDLKIPCCRRCNSEHLSSIECEIRNALDKGFDSFQKIDRSLLTLWLIKLYIGIVRKEATLSLDRANREAGNILDLEDIAPLRILQACMKGAFKPLNFKCSISDYPASVFIYKIKPGTGPNFHYGDTWSTMTLMLKLGEVGILAVFDMGIIAHAYPDLFLRHESNELHFQQFLELAARLRERSYAYQYSPFCSIEDLPNQVTITVESSYLSSGFYRFDEFCCEVFADAYELLGGDRNLVFSKDGFGKTILTYEDGKFRNI
jgi:hypothetical protein